MAICQLMVRDFMFGFGPEGYGEFDLVVAIDYAQAISEEGFEREPFHGYNLREFIGWAKGHDSAGARSGLGGGGPDELEAGMHAHEGPTRRGVHAPC